MSYVYIIGIFMMFAVYC